MEEYVKLNHGDTTDKQKPKQGNSMGQIAWFLQEINFKEREERKGNLYIYKKRLRRGIIQLHCMGSPWILIQTDEKM